MVEKPEGVLFSIREYKRKKQEGVCIYVDGTSNETVPFEQAEQFASALNAVGNKVDFLPIPGAFHNLRLEEFAPWTDEPWEELGWKALAFFQHHLL